MGNQTRASCELTLIRKPAETQRCHNHGFALDRELGRALIWRRTQPDAALSTDGEQFLFGGTLCGTKRRVRGAQK
eukprot:1660220-Pyramimonas_sp.AAC.1